MEAVSHHQQQQSKTATTSTNDDASLVASTSMITAQNDPTSGSSAAAAPIPNSLVSEHEEDDVANEDEDEDESEYEYEDEDETNFGGFLESSRHEPGPARIEDDSSTAVANNNNAARATSSSTVSSSSVASTTTTSKWREPSREAVTMSLRAERETTGGKRRLASDLYKIMMADTQEAGFSLEPKSDDSMDKWIIKLFQFDEDSNLHKDMVVLGIDHIELEMSFPDDYPFEPPFVRVVRPKFKKQSGFVMNGALCMELLTKDGWNPINDIESVIVSIRSLLVVGDGRLSAAVEMPSSKRDALLLAAKGSSSSKKRGRDEFDGNEEDDHQPPLAAAKCSKHAAGSYSMAEAKAAYAHLSDYHKRKGWDTSGWWRKKG